MAKLRKLLAGLAVAATCSATALATPALALGETPVSSAHSTTAVTAASQDIDTTEGLDLGQGARVESTVSINQEGVKEEALAAVRKWREDAYNNNIRWEYRDPSTFDTVKTTIPDALKKLGISKEDYFNPHWSYAMERIAIQRIAETMSEEINHSRPNHTWPFSLYYKGTTTTSEVLSWGDKTATQAVDHWADEKKDWVNQDPNAVTGHYTFLIDPQMLSYGFAGANQWRWSGEGMEKLDSDENATNWSGNLKFILPMDGKHFQDVSVKNPINLKIGATEAISMKEVYPGGRYDKDTPLTYITSLKSADENIAKVNGNSIVGVNPGTTTVTITSGDQSRDVTVNVTEASITAVDNPQQMTVASGTTQLDLPKTVHATFDNGTSRDVAVTWTDLSAEQKGILASRKGGVITLNGTVAGWDKPLTLTINVTPATVASVELSPADTNVTTPSGTAPALAKTGKVTWSNGDTTQEPVTWDAIDKSKYSPREGGEFDVNGTLAGKPVTAHVTVLPATVTSVKELSPVTTEAKQAPQLPKTAEVTWSNGDTTQEPVTWNISESDYAKRGEKQINGTILTGTKNEQKVSVTLTVTAHIVKVVNPEPITVASGTNPNGQLPSEVKVVYSDDEEGTAKVVWNTLSKDQYSAREGGTFTVTGSVEGTQLPATQTIKVTPATLDTVDAPADLTVVVDTQAKLPETLTGHYSNGDEAAVPVTWDSSTLDTHTVGDYTLSGTVDGYSKPVSLTVHVVAAKIISVEEPTPLTVPSGTKKGELTLPQTVVAHFDNGTSADVAVTWSELTDADLQTLASRQGGTITLRGSVTGKAPASLNNLFVMLAAVAPSDVTLTINVEPATVTGASVEPTTVTTKAQTAPQLPENATVTWSNGDTTQEPVTWDEVNPQDYQNPDGNSFQVSGTVAGQKVSVTVNVTPLEITSITLTKDTVEIEQGAGFEMPNAIVTYENGSTTVLHPRWEDKSASEIHNPGSYVYNGTVTVRGEEKPVSFTLVVKEKAKEEPGKDDNKPGEKDNEGGKKPSKPAEPSKPAKPQVDGKKASSKPHTLASTGASVSIILLVALTALTAGAALRMSTRKH